MNIKGVSKAKILSALYNNAKVQGMGFIHFVSGDMSTKEAQSMLDSGQTYFDYVKGRVMKIDLSKETELDTRLYNRDNGHNAAENIINKIYLRNMVQQRRKNNVS